VRADNIIFEKIASNPKSKDYTFDPTSDGEFSIKKHLNGFARVVVYSSEDGVISVQEGHFVNGVQNSFGRIINLSN